ncbi:PH domain-containing protein [Corynebacterium pygosceleis]|uniref:PH domain-containing protein n=1 Tax=Corynebacterium pygosceleis TaxID=2800406 RepID=A0A9Q4GJE5_9CORY|nr:PH domain-containing protein [Corynebacterium pygosceleis]MCK7637607.1 PH domain-containing protein [Corynebacterium pygosceleis]MCK7674798.1 PH domain-containing protein [Corynebacterium pygosceleis]MCL0119613.1 PH domain-containing protein [Corynebacterium pygosceleis]MCX7444854.1 PH domain-containing protein [Corynebacterium pygosceleis]MCX7468064.1 PH domain-containing protein [Corynebacterium pygosceleis]
MTQFTDSTPLTPVSPDLAKARLIVVLPVPVVLALGCAVAAWWWTPWFWIGAALMLLTTFYLAWLIPAQVRHLGWAETGDELLITRGRLWYTFTVVPYGRVQFVDLTSGPVQRHFGLRTLTLHTASSTSDSEIPGLDADTAEALRDRLAVKARERMSGL